MAQFIVDDFHKDMLDALDFATVREIRKKVVWAGAKVVEKEMSNYIASNHHISGDMEKSVAQGPIHEDIDSTWVAVWPQGMDSRGVYNEMKHKIINTGYYNTFTGKSHRQKDPYVRKMRKQLEPRIRAVMEQQFKICMDELNK